jgi:class 3 adenylate cyclase/tetratricopeptide (TPR) repeat protein
MFCDLVDSTPLSSRLDPEDMREVISAYHACVSEVMESFGGFVARYMGDGALIYFGYPGAQEDDAERALRAGLALIDRISRKEFSFGKLASRVGIATGLVVVGELLGGEQAYERDIVGETPNLAARLQSLAEPNTVLIAANTRRLIGHLFELRYLGEVEVKGFAGAVPVWEVQRPSEVESRFEAMHESSLTPLVGRQEEIDLLSRRWARAKAGDGQVVLVLGEPGLGKSRLAVALQEQLHGEPHLTLRYFCSPHHRDSPLHPFIVQLERAAGFAREDTPQTRLDKLEALLLQAGEGPTAAAALFADLLTVPNNGRYPPLPADPQRRRELALTALMRRLESLARNQPVLVIFEDAHWIDPTSHELLDLAVERVGSLPVLLIVTFRPEFQPPWTGQPQVTMLVLNRLGRHDRTVLVEQIAAGKSLPDGVIDKIVDRTDGVPLFIEELTKSILESGLLREEADRYVLDRPLPPLAIPSSLHASLMARLDRLSPAREVAQIGASLGREFSYEVLAALAGRPDDELRHALDQLAGAGLIFRRGVPPRAAYTFKHTLVQDAAYGTLLLSQRRELHARIGKVLEEQFPETAATQPEVLAHHYAQAGLVDPAIEYWRIAGERALRRSAMVEAASHLTRGNELIRLLPAGRERDRKELDMTLPLAQATWAVRGHGAETRQMFARARDLLDVSAPAAEQISVLHGLWRVENHRGDLVAARELAQQSLALAARHDHTETSGQANRALGTTLFWMGMCVEARRYLERALEFYALGQQDIPIDSLFRAGNGLSTLGLTLWPLGYPDQAATAFTQALADARGSGHAVALGITLWGVSLYEAGFGACPPSEAKHVDEAITHCADHLKTYEPWVRFNRGILSVRCGDFLHGMEVMQHAMAAAKEFNAGRGHPLRLGHLAVAHAGLGQAKIGIGLLDEAILTAEQTQERVFEAELHRLRGELLVQLNNKREAAAALKRALTVARRQQARMWELRAATSLARLWRDQGKLAQARDLLAPIYGWFTEGFDTPDLREAKALLEALDA